MAKTESFALKGMVEKYSKGRWDRVRSPYEKELKATAIYAFKIDEVSAKIRAGDPAEEPEDLDFPVWAGVLPIGVAKLTPIASKDLSDEYECEIKWE